MLLEQMGNRKVGPRGWKPYAISTRMSLAAPISISPIMLKHEWMEHVDCEDLF